LEYLPGDGDVSHLEGEEGLMAATRPV
jgi:hypothetical protein